MFLGSGKDPEMRKYKRQLWRGYEHNDQEFTLTPRTEAKYNKIDEEFHLMMQRNQVNGVRVIIMRRMMTMMMRMIMIMQRNQKSTGLG